jgi:imidazolonepropionase-like amidohydrolase
MSRPLLLRHAAATLLFAVPLLAACSDSDVPPATHALPPGEPPAGPTDVGCAECTTIVGGVVFDGTDAGPGTVVLLGDRIAAVERGEVRVVAGETLDATGHTVLPGLFDMHVHSPGESAPYGYFSPVDLMEANMKGRLRAGVLSYLDVGSMAHLIFETRDRARSGAMLASNVFAAGPLFTPQGGHPCTDGQPPQDFCVFIDSPADVAPGLAGLMPQAPDVIKVVIENGEPTSPLPRIDQASLDALASAVRAEGLEPIAHVNGSDDMRMALDAGVRFFAHMPGEDLLDSAIVARLVAADARIVSTLVVYDSLWRISTGDLTSFLDPALADEVPPGVLASFQDEALLAGMQAPALQALYTGWRDNAFANFVACHAAGVGLVTGTDAGNPGVFHGPSLRRELALSVELGMTPVEALRAGTRDAADMLGPDKRPTLGRLATGAVADVVIVAGDASADIGALAQVRDVIRAGRRLDLPSLSQLADTTLFEQPQTGLGAGATCLGAGECGDDLYCSWLSSCAPVCGATNACDSGDACFPQAASSEGWCYPGDHCDLIGQDCVNGQACIWLGNASSVCWFAGTGTDGQACDAEIACAPGHQCSLSSGKCAALCDPRGPNTCPAPKICTDRSAQAGLIIGECQ